MAFHSRQGHNCNVEIWGSSLMLQQSLSSIGIIRTSSFETNTQVLQNTAILDYIRGFRMESNGDIISLKSVFGTDMIEIEIKALDFQMYPLQVNMQIHASKLKEQVTIITGVVTQHLHILYVGMVLRD